VRTVRKRWSLIARLVFLLAMLAFLGACSNPLVRQMREQIQGDIDAVFWYEDDEIGLDLSYSSDNLVLDETAPIYIEAYAIPFPYPFSGDPEVVSVISDFVITESGKYVIPQSALPGNASQVMLRLIHDLNGSYESDGDTEDPSDTARFVKAGVDGNTIDEDETSDLIVSAPQAGDEYYDINPDYIVSVGTSLEIEYTDSSTVSADGFETSDDLGPDVSREISQGTFETARTLHTLDDVDFLRFTPATTDRYEIRVAETTFNLKVSVYNSDSDALTDTSSIFSDTGTAERIINPGGTELFGGTEYFVRVESPSNGLGSYEVGFFFQPATADAAEDDDTKANAVPLAVGRANSVTRTFDLEYGSFDEDWFSIDLEEGYRYMVEVREDPTYFGGSADARGIDPEFRVEEADGSSTNLWHETDDSTLMINLQDYNWNGTDTYYLRIRNATPPVGLEDYPTGRYTVTLTYGPDQLDNQDLPYTGIDEYTEFNEHAPGGNTIALDVSPRLSGFERTIYSTEAGTDPEDDVDWLEVRIQNSLTDYLIYTEPVAGEDGVITDFTVYTATGTPLEPNLGDPVASGQPWSGASDEPVRGANFEPSGHTGDDSEYPAIASTEDTFFVRVTRSTQWSGNPLTGRYRVVFKAGGDNEDDQDPDSQITVSSVDYGIDETPWIGQPNSTDFSTRNKLADASDWDGTSTPMLYRTIYRRDYDFGTGEPDGVTDQTVDYDWVWVEVPGGASSVDLFVIASHEDQDIGGMPIKATVYSVDQSGSSALDAIRNSDNNADKVLTVAELDSLVGTYDSSGYYGTNGSHSIVETGIAVSAGDVLFIRIERDNANATGSDPETTEYSIRVRR
jgi:hypothetical protein